MPHRYDNEHEHASYPSEAWFYKVFRIQDGWMALARPEPFRDIVDALRPEGPLWYAFGDTYKEALDGLESAAKGAEPTL